jgi:hypothetical protein
MAFRFVLNTYLSTTIGSNQLIGFYGNCFQKQHTNFLDQSNFIFLKVVQQPLDAKRNKKVKANPKGSARFAGQRLPLFNFVQ